MWTVSVYKKLKKHLWKNSNTYINWSIPCHGLKDSAWENSICFLILICRFNTIPIKSSVEFLVEVSKLILRFILKEKEPE